jgi:mono/diheme cytochrome c family protein
MKSGLKIFGFVIIVLAFYSYVGQTVPQMITYPPETAELSSDMTSEDLAVAGAEIVAGKGTCLGCHTVGSEDTGLRFPDLGGIGDRAATRIADMSDIEYLAHSLYEPDDYIVDGFLGGMPVINRPPIGLSDDEIKAVIAYLQSLGGEPTITLATDLGYRTEVSAAPAPTSAATIGSRLDGLGVFTTYLCSSCHTIDSPDALVGPSLYDVGSRLSTAEIYEAVMDPDASIADGFPAAVMAATMNASGFYQQVSPEELRALVNYLSEQKGE